MHDRLKTLSAELQETYQSTRRVMSFPEYLDLVEQRPKEQLRSAPQYIRDCFDHWGTTEINYPWGRLRRFNLFDCPWANGRDRLIGQEAVQNQVYRSLCNFVSEGTANKLILLHGPNGSAKSTLVGCIGRAMQAYSRLDAGALYRFNWVFPSGKVASAGIGFSQEFSDVSSKDSYAHLPDQLIDAKICDELGDHPILLLPSEHRNVLLDELLGPNETNSENGFVRSDYVQHGQLSHRNRHIFDALLTTYQGDYLKVLRHVQVERFFVSHRYRQSYVTVEPQLSVDAQERQITQDSTIAALPPSLQSLSLFTYGGQLVNGNRGLIEYSDLLKRPLEAYKYLLTTVEHSSVSLQNASLFLDMCFIGTSNEIHLSAFKEIPEFQSFKGRLNLIRVPYLLDQAKEEQIYATKVQEAARSRHIAPHCAYVASLWAVLTRMRKPTPDRYPKELSEIIAKLTSLQKAELYSEGRLPDGLTTKQGRELTAQLPALHAETETHHAYEGRTGASPRELHTIIFNAANSNRTNYVSPLAILDEISELCKQVSVYAFLKEDSLPGGYQDHAVVVEQVRKRLLDRINQDFRAAMGLVDDAAYQRLFSHYINHVIHYTKGERLRNETTGALEPPDEKMMAEVESTLAIDDPPAEFRNALISKIGAWSLDHPNARPNYEEIFRDHFEKLRDAYYKEHEKVVSVAIRHFLMLVTDAKSELNEDDRDRAETTLANLTTEHGYNIDSARDLVRELANARYSG